MSRTELEPAPPMRITPAPTPCAPYTTHHYVGARVTHSVEIAFERNSSFGMTGGGDQFKILFTVLEFIKENLVEIVENTGAKKVSFTSSGDSRTKLYSKRLVPIISELLGNNWIGPEIVGYYGGGSEFIWERKLSLHNIAPKR